MSRSFWKFCSFVNTPIFTKHAYLGAYADTLQNFLTQSDKNVLILNLPQGAGKSLYVRHLCAYMIGVAPKSTEILCITSTDARATDNVLSVANIVAMPEFRYFFPEFPAVQYSNKTEIRLDGNANFSYYAGGFGSSYASVRCNVLVIDDIYADYADAVSGATNDKILRKWETTLYSRLKSDSNKIIVCGTRYTKNDFYAYLANFFDKQIFAQVRVPALDENGNSFCEAVRSTNALELIKSKLDTDIWNAVYMQQPTAEGQCNLFANLEFRYGEPPTEAKRFITIDPAEEYGSDNFVCCYFAKYGGGLYLLDIFARQRYELREVAEWLKAKGCVCFMERNGGGNDKRKRLIQEFGLNIIGFTTHLNKYSRAVQVKDGINERLFVSRHCERQEDMLRCLRGFPQAPHDDFTDCLIMGFENEIKI